MNTTAIAALVRNDLRIFRTDRRAVVIGILVPILIAAFFGYVFGGTGNAEAGRIPIIVVDEDQSSVSQAIAADLQKDTLVAVQLLDRAQAQTRVKSGKAQVAAIIPKGFGNDSVRSLFTSRDKPTVEMLIDPSQAMSSKVIEGLLVQYGMQEITKSAFAGQAGEDMLTDYISRSRTDGADHPESVDLNSLLQSLQHLRQRADSAGNTSSGLGLQRGLTMPYQVSTTKVTSGTDVVYNGYAHSFAGMTVQFLLLAGVDAGVVLLLLRERGIWQRLRSAPLTKTEFLIAKTLATMLIGLFQIAVIYAAALGIFGVRISGSVVGFFAIAVALSFMNATFGLMLASLGRSAPATRGIAVLVTLLMVMVGGAWVPSFVFPKWLQQASLAVPTRWAVDGLDAMTWRGLPISSAVPSVLVLSLVATVCLIVAIFRFRWDD
jgi:ABC-2 type transport system permease protein